MPVHDSAEDLNKLEAQPHIAWNLNPSSAFISRARNTNLRQKHLSLSVTNKKLHLTPKLRNLIWHQHFLTITNFFKNI